MEIIYDENKFGDMLMKHRRKKGYSQSKLAKEIGVSRQAVNEWERGVYIPTLDKKEKIEKILDFKMEGTNMLTMNNINKKADKKIILNENGIVEVKLEIKTYQDLLKYSRFILGYSQDFVASKITNNNRPQYTHWENGDFIPKIETRKLLADILQFDFNLGEYLLLGIANIIKRDRKQLGLSCKEFAEFLDVSVSRLQKVEIGERRMDMEEYQERLSKSLCKIDKQINKLIKLKNNFQKSIDKI